MWAAAVARALELQAHGTFPALVALLVDVLHRTNAFFVHHRESVGGTQQYRPEALLRRSVLGAFAILFDILPTFFLWPTLPWLVSLERIFSSSFQGQTGENPEAVAALEATLAEKSPMRVLLPGLCVTVTAPLDPFRSLDVTSISITI